MLHGWVTPRCFCALGMQGSSAKPCQGWPQAAPLGPPCWGRKLQGFCESERTKHHRQCQEKQGFQVEITRFSSRSKSRRSKTLPFAMATRFPLRLSPPYGENNPSAGLGSLAKCYPGAQPELSSSRDPICLPGSPHPAALAGRLEARAAKPVP